MKNFKSKIKLIRVINELDFGGVESRMLLTAEGFYKDSDVEMLLVVLGRGGKIEQELRKKFPETRILILDQNYAIPNFRLIKDLRRIFTNESPAVVHCSGAESNFHGIWASILAGVEIRLAEEIGYPNHGIHWRILFRITYGISTQVICISNSVAKFISNLNEVNLGKTKVIYNPVKKPIWKNFGEEISFSGHSNSETETFVFVTTCRLVPIKNLPMLLESFAVLCQKIPEKTLELWIVGEGPERDRLIKLSQELNISDQVRFWGFTPNVGWFLKQSDVFVLPSKSEGFSISLVEAMTLGLPCIATQAGGPSEIIENGQSGFLFNPNVKSELIHTMEYLVLMDHGQLKEIGQRAQEVSTSYSLENYINALKENYFSFINREG